MDDIVDHRRAERQSARAYQGDLRLAHDALEIAQTPKRAQPRTECFSGHDESVIRCHLKSAFGELRLNQLTTARCKDFRKKHQDDELSGKTAGNILGNLHKAMADAVEDGLSDTNPVPKLTRRRRKALMRKNSNPLTVAEGSVPGRCA